jgi:hypothetical protein
MKRCAVPPDSHSRADIRHGGLQAELQLGEGQEESGQGTVAVTPLTPPRS